MFNQPYTTHALCDCLVLSQDESEDLGDCLPLNGRLEVRSPDSAI
jgi:hypothetical protein